MTDIIAPRRDEQLIQGDKASQRYIKFFEELSNAQNLVSVSTAITIVLGSGNYTTLASNTLICTGEANIILNGNPLDREIVTVITTSGNVTVDGNGRTINEETEIIMHIDRMVLDFFYSLEQNKWFLQ